MKSEDIDDLIAGAALGDLSAEEATALEHALAADPTLHRRIESARSTLDLVALVESPMRPPPHVRATLIRHAMRSTVAAPERGGSRRTWVFAWGVASSLTAVAAVVVATVLATRISDLESKVSGMAVAMSDDRTALAAVYRERPRISTLEAEAEAEGAWAKLMVSSDGMHGMLIVEGLHAPPAGMAYQLWLVRDGVRANGGVFRTDDGGRAILSIYLGESLLDFQRAGVTKEPASGSVEPTGSRMLGGTLQ